MEGSKLPFSYWLAGMQFLTATISKRVFQNIKKKAMLHKLRMVMGHRDNLSTN